MITNTGYTYFIVAPDYRESSLGVQVLHRLCHMINERGGRAWMICNQTNPDWNSPVCTEAAFNELMNSGDPWIAVYPDVTRGNPLGAPVVVRYMLNREGAIEENSIDAGDEDLFFWYRDEFADKEPQPNILGIECYDLDLFCDDQPVKDLDLIYINRLPEEVIQFDKLPKGITMLTMANPYPLKELAGLLKRARVLYTYEASGTCLLANLCGCPVVALSAPGYEDYALNLQTLKDIGDAGFSFSDTPDALETVKAGLYKVRDHLLLKRKLLDEQLDRFVQLSQEKARQTHDTMLPSSLGVWLNSRTLPKETAAGGVRLLHVVFCRQAPLETIATTIDSIAPGFDDTQNLLLMVGLPPHVALDDGKKIFAATQANWLEMVNLLAQDARFDWLHCIDAGVCYAADGIRLMQNVLLEAGECQAIYTDEALLDANGIANPCFKPDFNLDLFLSSPQRYLRRIFFRREGWLESGGFDPTFASSFEFEIIIRYIFQWDTGYIGHISEVTTLLTEDLFAESCPHEERRVLDFYLSQRGFHDARIEAKPHGAWHIQYQPPVAERVTILLDGGDDPAMLQRCVESLFRDTNWPNIEVLLSLTPHASEESHRVGLALASAYSAVRLCISEPGHNFAMRMNQLEHLATGDVLLVLHRQSQFLAKSWLTVLMNHAQRPEVGCVGPMIISPVRKIMSTGIITGADGWLGHIAQGENWQAKGYLARHYCEQNYSALSGNCLLVKRSAWQAVGGMDTSYDNEFIEDVVLSLTLRAAGYLCVWTPYSIIASDNPRLLRGNSIAGHDEQMTRLITAMPQIFTEDPTYNRNLNLSLPYFHIPETLTADWDPLSVNTTPSVLLVGSGREGANARRMRYLLREMAEAGDIRLTVMKKAPSLTELLRAKPAILILNGNMSAVSCEMLDMLRNAFPCRVLGLADDVQDQSSQWHALSVDRWLTFYPAQQAFLQKNNRPVTRMPAGLTASWFTRIITPQRVEKTAKPRILCVPRGWKQKEFNFMQSVIASSAASVDWVLLGEWPKSWVPFVKETWRFEHGDVNPQQLLRLNVDAAVIFHNSNDNSRTRDAHLIYQLAVCNIPVIASDVPALECDIPVLKVKADYKKWLQAIESVSQQLTNNGSLAERVKADYRIARSEAISLCQAIIGEDQPVALGEIKTA